MTVREAAQLLDVSEKQVQHLGRRGEVAYMARGLLYALSVRSYQAARQGKHTRGWAGSTAWAAIALLSGLDAAWIGQPQLSRLRSRLNAMDASALVAATRNRALIGHFSGHVAATARLTNDPRTVSRSPLPGIVGAAVEQLQDWYIDQKDEAALVRAYGLRADTNGAFVIRAVKADSLLRGVDLLGLIETFMSKGEVLTALDSATSEDPREKAAATALVDQALNRLRANGK